MSDCKACLLHNNKKYKDLYGKTNKNKNGTIVGYGCDNKVNDDMSGKLEPQNSVHGC